MSTPKQTITVSEKTGNKITIIDAFCKGCQICADVCPTNTLKMKAVGTRWQGSVVMVAEADNCIACMKCEQQCPDFAILIEKGEKKQKKAPVA